MSTNAQILANRDNAQSSTGPRTPEGKGRVARNALTLGLFTMNDFVLPEESDEHRQFCTRFWKDLLPSGSVEETFATEMIRAAWRLRRCGLMEAKLAESPEQNEANTRTQTAVDRARALANSLFRRAHTELRRLQAERPRLERLYPVSAPRDGFVSSNSAEPVRTPKPLSAIQSQSVPRSAPCPCASGEKFKRCCGRTSPGLLHSAA